ncbi:MAG: cation-transporting P-type ATPase [Geminicoccaceae bacterium]|nr:cation-transporting P-type ATPase [Geminicoccaceae bacterium]
MASEPRPDRRITPVHTAVPGRVRVKVRGLKGCARTARALEREAVAHAKIERARANPVTGSLLVEHHPSLDLATLFRWLEGLLDRLPELLAPSVEPSPARPAPAPADPPTGPAWHTLSAEECASLLATDPERGLTSAEARARLARDGPNSLPAARVRSELSILADQLLSLPVGLLAVSAAVSLATGGLADAVVILGVVGLNATIGWYTESRAERIIASLETSEPRPAPVLRDGSVERIAAEEIVRGDLLLLQPGERIAADGRLVAEDGLVVDESALTGESLPVRKRVAALSDPLAPIADRTCLVYRGSVVTGGSGRAIVVATGPASEAGRIQALLGSVAPPPTPLQQRLDDLGRQLVLLSAGVCVGIFGVGLARGLGLLPMLSTAVSLAVAALPEGLPAVATTTLALGIGRMRAKNVLVRKLAAIETLGSVQVLCFDKTGTLTQNRMAVGAVGLGCGPAYRRGATIEALLGPAEARPPATADLLAVAALCSEVALDGDGSEASLEGSPTETALVRLALEAGLDVHGLRRARPLLQLVPRSEERPWMASVHALPGGGRLIAVKGSPAAVLERCTTVRGPDGLAPLDAERRRRALAMNESMATEGLRVLGFAIAERGPGEPAAIEDLVWLGLVGLADPIRPGMKELIRTFHGAGIRTVMITGDQSATAYAIARELELAGEDEIEILDSTRLDRLEPAMLEALAPRVHVFARVSPSHKLAIVRALQRKGLVVAMTGDGVNDGPALKAADVGVAMGKGGTEVAREIADIVLADDELATMATAIAEGRTTYADIKKAVHYLLSTNLSEIAVTAAGVAVGAGAIVSPIQLLWLNLVSDVLPALALALEPAEPDVLARPPRDPRAPFTTGRELARYGREGMVISAGALAAWAAARALHGPAAPVAGTVAFHTVTTAQLLHALACRSDRRVLLPGGPPLSRNPWLEAALPASGAIQLATLLVPPLRNLLGLAPLGPLELALVAAGSLLPLLLNEALKPAGTPSDGGPPP